MTYRRFLKYYKNMYTNLWRVLFLLGFIVILPSFVSVNTSEEQVRIVEEPKVVANPLDQEERIPISGSIAESFSKIGLGPLDIHKLITIAKPFHNLNRVRPSVTYQFRGTPATEISLNISKTRSLIFEKQDDMSWSVSEKLREIETRKVQFQGRVTSSLWESAIEANMDPQLIVDLAEIFAWQIDFAREVRTNDQWRIVVEKRYVDHEFIGWGSVIAAEYINNDRKYDAYRFERDDKLIGYFDHSGRSLQKLFLKSPLKYGRVSSRFSRRRFHPIRKVYRPHLGVDYAAPIGTPVRAVGDGTVILRARKGGAGKMIRIRHNRIYKSAYLHLNSYAKGIRKGSKVTQGQVIGYVGKTGLATGPHLHYEFYKYGQYMDPLAVEFPTADPVPSNLMAEFQQEIKSHAGHLPEWETQVADLGKASAIRSPASQSR